MLVEHGTSAHEPFEPSEVPSKTSFRYSPGLEYVFMHTSPTRARSIRGLEGMYETHGDWCAPEDVLWIRRTFISQANQEGNIYLTSFAPAAALLPIYSTAS